MLTSKSRTGIKFQNEMLITLDEIIHRAHTQTQHRGSLLVGLVNTNDRPFGPTPWEEPLANSNYSWPADFWQ